MRRGGDLHVPDGPVVVMFSLFVLGAFVSGWVTFGVGSPGGRLAVAVHGILGIAAPLAVALGLRSLRYEAAEKGALGARLMLAGAVAVTAVFGVVLVVGFWPPAGDVSVFTAHVAAGIVSVAVLVGLFVVSRHRARIPVEGRREMLRQAAVVGGGLFLAGWAGRWAIDTALRATGAPGADRRFTGSFEVASFDPVNLPDVSWIDDSDPYSARDRDQYELRIEGVGDETLWSHEELDGFDDRLTATLDCTGGWYSRQRWEGVFVERLLGADVSGSSLLVHSATGYTRRFPLSDAGRLLIATRIGGEPLLPRHGAPARLVASGRRGYWWVKWVDRIEVSERPWWWQPPLPLT